MVNSLVGSHQPMTLLLSVPPYIVVSWVQKIVSLSPLSAKLCFVLHFGFRRQHFIGLFPKEDTATVSEKVSWMSFLPEFISRFLMRGSGVIAISPRKAS